MASSLGTVEGSLAIHRYTTVQVSLLQRESTLARPEAEAQVREGQLAYPVDFSLRAALFWPYSMDSIAAVAETTGLEEAEESWQEWVERDPRAVLTYCRVWWGELVQLIQPSTVPENPAPGLPSS